MEGIISRLYFQVGIQVGMKVNEYRIREGNRGEMRIVEGEGPGVFF